MVKADAINTNYQSSPISLKYRGTWALRVSLLVVLAAGLTVNNMVLFSLIGYPVRPTFLLAFVFLFLVVVRCIIRPCSPRPYMLVLPVLLLLYEFLVHGMVSLKITDGSWISSFALLILSLGIVMVSSTFRLSQKQLSSLSTLTSWLAYLMGGVGIIQFVVSNKQGSPWYVIPETFRLRQDFAEAELNKMRFGSLIRATGLSSEPSYYGTGMVVIAALCLTFLYLAPQRGLARWFQIGALLTSLIGVVISASVAAWGLAMMVLIGWLIAGIRLEGLLIKITRLKLSAWQRKMIRNLILLGSSISIVILIWLAPSLQDRFEGILEGEDSSARLRVILAFNLIVQPGQTLSESLFGVGIGLQDQTTRIFDEYRNLDAPPHVYEKDADMWNGYAYLAVTMGWFGLGLVVLLLIKLIWTKNHAPISLIHLYALVIFYPTTQGVILTTEWWALIGFVAVLQRFYKPVHSGQLLHSSTKNCETSRLLSSGGI